MATVTYSLCDNTNCNKRFERWQAKYRLTIEYSSRSRYSREYCSSMCMVGDLLNFKEHASRKDMSS